MLNKLFSPSLLVALFAMLIGVSSLNAQDITKSDMMKKHPKMKSEMSGIDVMKADTNGDGTVFACPMGCEVKDEAGSCSKCKMKLEEMSIDDTSAMLKEKGFNVVDHYAMKMEMKKNCKPGCEKPNCAKKEMTNAKECKPGCEKPCCAKKELTEAKACKQDSQKPNCAKKENAVSDAKAFNKVCPMSGEPVDTSVQTVSYNGKNYGFCGSGCVAHFNADTAKYSKNLSEDGTKFVAGPM